MPSRGPSPAGQRRSFSPVCEETAATPEPSPLMSKKVSGESPPKVIKRKPPAPSPTDEIATQSEDSKPEEIAVARPVVPEIKPAEGALPPPPVRSKAPALIVPTIVEVTPGSPVSPSKPVDPPKPSLSRPSSPSVGPPSPQPSKSPTPEPKSMSPPSAPKRAVSLTGSTSSRPTPRSPHQQQLQSTSSTEHLIPPPSPEPLRPGTHLAEIKSVKKQPKSGWL